MIQESSAPVAEPLKEHRYRFFTVSARDILTLLGNWRQQKYVALPVIKGIPVDAEVRGVMHQWEYDAFLVKVFHPSFDVIHPAQYPKKEPCETEMISLPVDESGKVVLP